MKKTSKANSDVYGYGFKSLREILSMQKGASHMKPKKNIIKSRKLKEKQEITDEYLALINEVANFPYRPNSISPNEILWLILCMPISRSVMDQGNTGFIAQKHGIVFSIPNTLVLGPDDKHVLLKTDAQGTLQRIVQPNENELAKAFGSESTVLVKDINFADTVLAETDTSASNKKVNLSLVYTGQHIAEMHWTDFQKQHFDGMQGNQTNTVKPYRVQSVPVQVARRDGYRQIIRVCYRSYTESQAWQLLEKVNQAVEDPNRLLLESLNDSADAKWDEVVTKIIHHDSVNVAKDYVSNDLSKYIAAESTRLTQGYISSMHRDSLPSNQTQSPSHFEVSSIDNENNGIETRNPSTEKAVETDDNESKSPETEISSRLRATLNLSRNQNADLLSSNFQKTADSGNHVSTAIPLLRKTKRLHSLSAVSYKVDHLDHPKENQAITALRRAAEHISKILRKEVKVLVADFILDNHSNLVLTDFIGIRFSLSNSCVPLPIPTHVEEMVQSVYGFHSKTKGYEDIKTKYLPMRTELKVEGLEGRPMETSRPMKGICSLCNFQYKEESEKLVVTTEVLSTSLSHLMMRLPQKDWPDFCSKQRLDEINSTLTQHSPSSSAMSDQGQSLCKLCSQVLSQEQVLIGLENNIRNLVNANSVASFSSTGKADKEKVKLAPGCSIDVGGSAITTHPPRLRNISATASPTLALPAQSASQARKLRPASAGAVRVRNTLSQPSTGVSILSSTLGHAKNLWTTDRELMPSPEMPKDTVESNLLKMLEGEGIANLRYDMPTGAVVPSDAICNQAGVSLSRVMLALSEIRGIPDAFTEMYSELSMSYCFLGRDFDIPCRISSSTSMTQTASVDLHSMHMSHIVTTGNCNVDVSLTDPVPCSLGRFLACHRKILVILQGRNKTISTEGLARSLERTTKFAQSEAFPNTVDEELEEAPHCTRGHATAEGDALPDNALAYGYLSFASFRRLSNPMRKGCRIPLVSVVNQKLSSTNSSTGNSLELICSLGLQRLLYPVERKRLPATLRYLGLLGQAFVPLNEADVFAFTHQPVPQNWIDDSYSSLFDQEISSIAHADDDDSPSQNVETGTSALFEKDVGVGIDSDNKLYFERITSKQLGGSHLWCLAVRIEDGVNLNLAIDAPVSPWPWVCEYSLLGDSVVVNCAHVDSNSNNRESLYFCSTSLHIWRGNEHNLIDVIKLVKDIRLKVRGVEETRQLAKSCELERLLAREKGVRERPRSAGQRQTFLQNKEIGDADIKSNTGSPSKRWRPKSDNPITVPRVRPQGPSPLLPYDVILRGKMEMDKSLVSERFLERRVDLQLDPHLRKAKADGRPREAFLNVMAELYRLPAAEERLIMSLNRDQMKDYEILPGVRKLYFSNQKSKVWTSVLSTCLTSV